MSGSILCDELLRYYHNKQLLQAKKNLSEQLESLNADYDALLRRLQEDPNLIKRIAPATLGTEPNDTNTIYPKVKAEQLAAARKALMEKSSRRPIEPAVPGWLTRCSEPRQRISLFLAGAGLILISFICFRAKVS